VKAEKLDYLKKALTSEFPTSSTKAEIHYKIGTQWFGLDKEVRQNSLLFENLENAVKESAPHTPKNSQTVIFHFIEDELTISLTFEKNPQNLNIKNTKLRLEKVRESALNAYKVSHNPLTYLLAKDAFRDRLCKSIANFPEKKKKDNDAQDNDAPKSLAILALDIDFFKQVNDTWGHLYGDQVLKIFAKRLEDTAKKIMNRSETKITIDVGHPSGEEFLILIEANEIREVFESWANEFRAKISEEVLPSEREWEWLENNNGNSNLSELSPPPIQERVITTSIGVALFSPAAGSEPYTDPTTALLEAADTALYRAKAAGRNQVIFYDDILSKCGRVIEYDITTKVIAIDIGSNVGVSLRQEFKVFSPTYSGNKKFYVNDGRTIRNLGFYPRVETCKAIIFNTQPEISFAYVSTEENEVNVETNSYLEAIPAGSIGHLLPESSKYFPISKEVLHTGDIRPLQDYIKAETSNEAVPFAVVIKFNREAAYLKMHGTASLNNALARLYNEAQDKYNSASVIAVIDRGTICIAGKAEAYSEDTTILLTNEIAAEFPELGVACGVFHSTKNSEKLDPKNAVEFALFAASEHGRKPETRTRHFNSTTAKDVLYALRSSGNLETALADFERLRKLGINTAEFINAGGLIYGSLGLKQQAMSLYKAAIDKDQKRTIYKTNYGVTAYLSGEIDTPLSILNKVSQADIDKMKKAHPNGYSAYTTLLAKAKINESSSFIEERFLLMAPIALELNVGLKLKNRTELIERALLMLQSKP